MKAPIVVFAYKRIDHLRLCIEALKKNIYAKESTLIVYSDGAKSETDAGAVLEVRKYLSEISGFLKIEIIVREENLGLSKSILLGVSEMVNKYGKVIVLEDDLISSKYFLKFMNDALDRFETQEEVISIHGYIYPVEETLPEIFFLRGADCWGWATWKRGWDLLETDGKKLLETIRGRSNSSRFNFNDSYPYTRMLEDQIAGRNNSWAILWYASAFVRNKLTLYPGKSLLHNIGNDNSGTHSLSTNLYNVTISEQEVKLDQFNPILEDNALAIIAISDYFAKTHSRFSVLKTAIKRLLK